jgi:hypothetical protein
MQNLRDNRRADIVPGDQRLYFRYKTEFYFLGLASCFGVERLEMKLSTLL